MVYEYSNLFPFFLKPWRYHAEINVERTTLKLCCPFYHLFSPFFLLCYFEDKNLYHYIIIPFHMPYFNLQKKRTVEFFNSYGVFHSFVAFACCWSMLLYCDVTVNWFLILFPSTELFLIEETEHSINHGSSCLLRIFMVWPNYYLLCHLFSSFC